MADDVSLTVRGEVRQLVAHPLRDAVLDEIHARPFTQLSPPRRLVHLAFATDAAQTAADREMLAKFCASQGLAAPAPGQAYLRVQTPTFGLRWEQHTEFTTQTWDFPAESGFEVPASQLKFPSGAGWAPGPLVVALDVLVTTPGSVDPTDVFDTLSLAGATTYGGAAEVYTDFKRDAAGFSRILVIDRRLGEIRAGALVQRVIEIETYRTFALLGLPEARRIGPRVRAIEIALSNLTREMREAKGLADNQRLLDELSKLTADTEAISAETSYRFGASRAYDRIVAERLDVISEAGLENYPTWKLFLDRRMAPARRTLEATERRLEDLTGKLSRAAQLLRTRVDVEVERQNRDLLQSMNERAQMQLRLQQTVEGLSVVAISYYGVGLLYYALRGLTGIGLPFDPTVATGLLAPLIILLVWLGIRRIRKAVTGRAD